MGESSVRPDDPSDTGDEDRRVDDEQREVVLFDIYVVEISFKIRPAAKTQPPTACRMSESPVKLPMMKTFLATSRECSDSAFARNVRPDIRVVSVVVESGVLRISVRKGGERNSSVPRLPTT